MRGRRFSPSIDCGHWTKGTIATFKTPGKSQKLELRVVSEQIDQVVGCCEGPIVNWIPVVEGVLSFLNGPLRPTCVNSARHHLPPPEDTSEISKQTETTKTFSHKKRLVQGYET